MSTFPFRSLIFSVVLALFAFQNLFCQVVFREVPDYKIQLSDSLFFDITDTRSVISLNGNWTVRPADDASNGRASATSLIVKKHS